MAFADGNIIIGTSVDVGGIDTGLHKIQKSFKKLGRLAVTTIGVGAFYKLGKAAIDAASDLQEVQNVVDVAFTDMSYKIEEFSKVCIQHFGMSEFAAKQSAGQFMAMATAIGITKETASDMAVELVGLSGDFASFHNITQEYARVALSAVFTGETETIKRYGVILTEANLQEYAATIGITKKVKAMSAAEKTLLRYNYVMERTEMLHGDFERTQANWANTVRVLKEEWTELMVSMGPIFMQKVQPVVNVLNVIISKLIAIFKYLQQLLGIESEIGEATFTDEMEDMADAVEDVGNAIKIQLAPFDKLNNLTSKSSGNVDDNLSDLEKLYEKAKLSGYVIDAMKGFELQVVELSEKVKFKLAEMVNLFRKAKMRIEQIWNDIKVGNWFSSGKGLGTLISDLQQFLADAISGVDWVGVGEKIGEFFKGIIWSDALGGWVDVLIAALDGIISLAIAGISKINLEDVVKMAKNYSKAAVKFLKWLSSVLKRVDWKDFGKKVGKFIAELDWAGIFSATVDVMMSALSAAINAFTGLFDGLPLAGKVLIGLGAAWKAANWTGVIGALNDSLGEQLKNWKDSGAFTQVFKGAVGAISLFTGVSIILDTIDDIKAGEISHNDWSVKLDNLIGSLMTAFGTSMLVGAFGVTLGPAGFILTAGLTFIVSDIIDFVMSPDAEESLEIEKQKIRDQLSTISWWSEFENQTEIVLKLGVEAQGDIDDIEGKFKYYEDLANRWVELSNKTDELTSSEKNLLEFYGDSFSNMFPELKDKINKVTGAYEGQVEQLQLIIDKTKESMMLQTYKELEVKYQQQLVDAAATRYEFEKKISELEKIDLGSIVDEMVNEYMEWPHFDELGQRIFEFTEEDKQALAEKFSQELQTALETGASEVELDDFRFDLTKMEFDWSDELEDETFYSLVTALKDAQNGLEKYDAAVEQAYEDISHFRMEQAMLEDSLRSKEIILNLTQLSEKFNGTYEGVSDKWEKDVSAAAQSVLTELEKGEQISRDKVLILFNTINGGLADLPEGDLKKDLQTTLNTLYTQLINGKIQSADACEALAKAMNSGFSEGLKVDPTVESSTKKVFNSIDEVIQDTKTKVKKSMRETGRYIVDGYNEGIEESLPGAKKSGEKIIKVTEDGAETEGKIQSPSRLFREIGGYVVDGYVEGMLDKLNEITKASEEIIDATEEEFDNLQLSAMLSIIPKIARMSIPDVVKGMTIPTNISANSSTTVGGMSKGELSEILEKALSNLVLQTDGEVVSDSDNLFSFMQKEARIYKNRTGNIAFQ